jgi:hypothetical protein
MHRPLPLAVLIGAALAVALGAAGVLWAMSAGASTGETARFVPADAALYVAVNTDAASRQWAQTAQLLKRIGIDATLRNARDESAAATGVDWESDVAPFLGGEAALALLDLSGGTPAVLAVLATSDGRRAYERLTLTLDRQARERGDTPRSEQYDGVTIRIYPDDTVGEYAVAVKDRYLLLASDAALVRRALDTEAGKHESLGGTIKFRTGRAAVAGDALLFVYVNPAAVSRAAETFAGSRGTTEDALRAAGFDKAVIVAALSAEQDGFRFELQTLGIDADKNGFRMPRAADESRLARRVPADTLFFLYGANFYDGVWRGVMQALEQLKDDPDGAAPLAEFRDAIRELNRELGLDIERDLLAHLTGEYALAVGALDDDLGIAENPWVLALATAKDPQAVARALAKIADYERREGRRVETVKVGGVDVTVSRPAPRSFDDDEYAYTVAGSDLIFGYGPDTVVRGAVDAKNPLADDPDYKAALAALPDGRQLTMYVNLRRVIQIVRESSDEDAADWEALGRMRSLAIAFAQGEDRAGMVALLRIAER